MRKFLTGMSTNLVVCGTLDANIFRSLDGGVDFVVSIPSFLEIIITCRCHMDDYLGMVILPELEPLVSWKSQISVIYSNSTQFISNAALRSIRPKHHGLDVSYNDNSFS